MSYEKQIWNSGDIITADKLNHMEDGISTAGSDSGRALFEYIEFEYEGSAILSLPISFNELKAITEQGKIPVLVSRLLRNEDEEEGDSYGWWGGTYQLTMATHNPDEAGTANEPQYYSYFVLLAGDQLEEYYPDYFIFQSENDPDAPLHTPIS